MASRCAAISELAHERSARGDDLAGQPCVRGLRITVWDVLNWLAGGMTEDQILEDYPELEREDFRAVYEYAARLGKGVLILDKD